MSRGCIDEITASAVDAVSVNLLLAKVTSSESQGSEELWNEHLLHFRIDVGQVEWDGQVGRS